MSGSDFNTSFDFSGGGSSFDLADADLSFNDSVSFDSSSFSLDDSALSFDSATSLSFDDSVSFDASEFNFDDIELPTFDADTEIDFRTFDDAPIFVTPSDALKNTALSDENADVFATGLDAFSDLGFEAQEPVSNNAPLFGSLAIAGLAAVGELISGDFELEDLGGIVAQGAQNYAAFQADPDLLGTTEGQIQVATQTLAGTGLLGPELSVVLAGVSQGIEQDWDMVDQIVLNGINGLRASKILGDEADPVLAGIAAVAANGDQDTIEAAVRNLAKSWSESGILPRSSGGLVNLALDTNVLERLFGQDDTPEETLSVSNSGVQLNTNPTFTLDPGASFDPSALETANFPFTGADSSDSDE